ncbi:putative dimethylaniline monooxygenase [Aspergillus violaceofuscus CBS 115571]|uniref:Putative dimethylaniline monooxygenase n=1 Tax=Aspergillus violaceofuscus (strain CBS 115571) TaxID=1450538 RepID=A0A2V5I675_ASPV1|nr:putative dimethylaniline monooxygenase [Aspergillus violaceofuscus CBS 115571]
MTKTILNVRRVAVIGAGPAGAVATDALVKEQAFDTIRVFERQEVIGGTWVHTPRKDSRIPSLRNLVEHRADKGIQIPQSLPCETERAEAMSSYLHRFSDTGAHVNLHSNLPPSVMCFSQEPIPKILSERTLSQYGPDSPFRHREVMRDWVEDVFKRGNHEHLVEFETSVELAQHTGQEWVLTLRKSAAGCETDYWWQERFDAVVVATGHYYLPNIPNIPGIVEYDENYPGRIKHSKHYETSDEFKGKRVIVVGGSVSAFDALRDIRRVSKLPIISSLRKHSPIFGETPFTHPEIENHSEISSFDSETGAIHFADGAIAHDVDAIVFATGYDFSFPFLPDLGPVHKRVPGLYKHVFKIDNPSLALIGMVTGGFGIRIFEWQAVAAARVLAGRASLPSREEMEKWEEDRLAERGDGGPFWTLMPDFETHFEQLRELAGEPEPGTTGRVLPKYESAWADVFWDFINTRIEWWKKDQSRAEQSLG